MRPSGLLDRIARRIDEHAAPWARRVLAETGVLAGVPGAYRLQGQLEEIRIPLTAQAVLSARIDRLPPSARKMLQAASVIGRDVPLGLLASLAPMPADEWSVALAKLLSADAIVA